MMPDLGKYAFAVLVSYGVSLSVIAGLVALSLGQAARMRRALAEVEARQGKTDG